VDLRTSRGKSVVKPPKPPSSTVYIEGGSGPGDRRRQGFSKLLKDPENKRSPGIKLGGSRSTAIKLFCDSPDADPVLLIDSECALLDADQVQHLVKRKDIDATRATLLQSESVFLMVETMENWLIADMESITTNFKPAVQVRHRGGSATENVESISKAEAERVVAQCLPAKLAKGERMELIGKMNPGLLAERASEFARLLKRLHS
jgi:Domain of unknown function (DUF4276)